MRLSPAARSKPVVTASALDGQADSAAIDRMVAASIHEHRGLYTLDERLLQDLRPDLILTQELCEVCAVAYTAVRRAARLLPGDVPVVSLEPRTLGDILATIALVGELTGRAAAASALVSALRRRIAAVAERAARSPGRPRVCCLEWVDPPFRAGHWIPELVRLAGGVEVLGRAGEPSARASWPEIARAAPEVVVAMPCGFDIARAARELEAVRGRPEWRALPAVARGAVWIADGSAYFSRPGPRMVDGLEVLAHALHPDHFPRPAPDALRALGPRLPAPR